MLYNENAWSEKDDSKVANIKFVIFVSRNLSSSALIKLLIYSSTQRSPEVTRGHQRSPGASDLRSAIRTFDLMFESVAD